MDEKAAKRGVEECVLPDFGAELPAATRVFAGARPGRDDGCFAPWTPEAPVATLPPSGIAEGQSYLERIQEARQLAAASPDWFEGLKANVLQHCFGPEFASTARVGDVTDEEVSEFVASLNPPPTLSPHQRVLLEELLRNIEAWWTSSFSAMQSIHEESTQIMGFNALPLPPSPLPLKIQHRLKTIVRSVMHLMRYPSTQGTATLLSGGEAPGLQGGEDDVRYWTLMAQEHRESPKTVLREWLYQHFDKPYPTDQDKQLLSNITGLSRTQVSNWFINARVRIWQPMVMEMGRELGQQEGAADSGEEVSSSLKDERIQGGAFRARQPVMAQPIVYPLHPGPEMMLPGRPLEGREPESGLQTPRTK